MKNRKQKRKKKQSFSIWKAIKFLCIAAAIIVVAFTTIFFTMPSARNSISDWCYSRYLQARVAVGRFFSGNGNGYIKMEIPLNSNYYYGIDVSNYQKDIDWGKVAIEVGPDKKLPVAFAYLKATEGITIADKQYNKNRNKAEKSGIPTGAYHFFSMQSPADKQAEFFIKNVTLKKGDLRPVLDFEVTSLFHGKKELRRRALIWLEIIEKHYGCRPIIYTCHSIYKSLFKAPEFEKYDFWIASYDYDPKEDYVAWQFSQYGTVHGINHDTDLNLVKSKNDLRKLFY